MTKAKIDSLTKFLSMNVEADTVPSTSFTSTLDEDFKKEFPNSFTVCYSMYIGSGSRAGTLFTFYTSKEPVEAWFTL